MSVEGIHKHARLHPMLVVRPTFFPRPFLTDQSFVLMAVVSSFPGREQAEFTGERLAALGLKYDVMIHSSMARATETANIISKHLSGSG